MKAHQIVRSLLFVAGVSAVLSPAAASAQSSWTRNVSVYGGGGIIPAFNADLADSTIAAKLDVRDRKIKSAPVFGGSVGGWRDLGGLGARLGIRGEVSFQPAHADAQVNPAIGTFFGRPYDSVLPVPTIDGSSTSFTGAILFGWSHGRVMPYAGGGGGAIRTTAATSDAADNNVAGSWTGIAGLTISLGQRVSSYAEYRHTVVQPTLVLGTQTVVFTVKPNQLVAGLSVKL